MVQSSLGFQSQVNQVPAPGVEGDFCTLNPIYEMVAGPGGLVAGVLGATVGRFCWLDQTYLDPDNSPTNVNNFGYGQPVGILGRRQQGVITVFLQEATLFVSAGLPLGVISSADLWLKNRGATQAVPGQKAYANFADGSATFQASGAPLGGGSATGSTISAQTASFVGGIAGNVLTVASINSGTLYPGSILTGGSGLVAGTVLGGQLSGTTGGVGSYALSIGEQTVGSGVTLGTTYGLLTVGTLSGSPFAVNDTISGGAIPAGTRLTALISGSGGTGATFAVSNNTVIGSTTISVAASQIETNWYAQSGGLPGEVVKVSRTPQIAPLV
jgi:hypothetical protein